METAKFKRRKENFTCQFCGTQVKGNGYTDHCPECLCSLHVDVNPGDRASSCHGLMMPEGLEHKKGQMYISYKCTKCGYTHRNKSTSEDNFDALLALSGGAIALYHQKLRQRS